MIVLLLAVTTKWNLSAILEPGFVARPKHVKGDRADQYEKPYDPKFSRQM